MKHVASGDLVYHHTLTEIPLCKQTSLDAELICHITFMGRLWVWGKGDVVELAKAKPLAIDRHAKVAEIDGLPGGLGDLVGGGSRGFALRRQIRHDDSADARQSQHHRGEKRRSSFCSRDRWKAPPRKITESMRRGNQRGWKEHQNKEDKRPTRGRPSAGVRKGAAFPPLYACILLSSLLQLSELRCCLEETALASPPPPPSPLLQPLVIPFVQTGDLKCKTAPCWKSQPSSGQLSTGSLWLDCLCTAVNALGGCWPRWLTVVLGTATHCHVSRWCMRKKKKKEGEGGGGPQSIQPMLMMQQRTHLSLKHQQPPLTWNRGHLSVQCSYWDGCRGTSVSTRVIRPKILGINGYRVVLIPHHFFL